MNKTSQHNDNRSLSSGSFWKCTYKIQHACACLKATGRVRKLSARIPSGRWNRRHYCGRLLRQPQPAAETVMHAWSRSSTQSSLMLWHRTLWVKTAHTAFTPKHWLILKPLYWLYYQDHKTNYYKFHRLFHLIKVHTNYNFLEKIFVSGNFITHFCTAHNSEKKV